MQYALRFSISKIGSFFWAARMYNKVCAQYKGTYARVGYNLFAEIPNQRPFLGGLLHAGNIVLEIIQQLRNAHSGTGYTYQHQVESQADIEWPKIAFQNWERSGRSGGW